MTQIRLFHSASCLLLASLFASNAFAGATTVGGGGHGVNCGSHHVELLDLYEARQSSVYAPSPIVRPDQSLLSVSGSYQFVRSRLKEAGVRDDVINSAFKSSLTRLGQLVTEDSLVGNDASVLKFEFGPLSQTRDFGSVAVSLPIVCRLVQLASHQITFSGSVVLIDQDLYRDLPTQDKSALLIHEAFHEFFDTHASGDTRALREFVAYLFSDFQFRALNREAFLKLVETAHSSH